MNKSHLASLKKAILKSNRLRKLLSGICICRGQRSRLTARSSIALAKLQWILHQYLGIKWT